MTSLSPTEQGWNRVLLREHVGGRYHPNDYSTPPATQIRIGSAKGVVQIDPKDVETTNFQGPYMITLTESMAKVKYGPREFTKGPVHGMMIYDAAHYIVCIVKPAPTTYPARLSVST
jgi:hypothetical protein